MHIRNNHILTKKYATPRSHRNPIPTTHNLPWASASTTRKTPIIIHPPTPKHSIIQSTARKWIIIPIQSGTAIQTQTMRISNSNSSTWIPMLTSSNHQLSTSSRTSIRTLNFLHLGSRWRWVTISTVSSTTCNSSSRSRCGQTKHRLLRCSGSRDAWRCCRDSNGFIKDSRFWEESTSILAKKCRKWIPKKNGIISNSIMTSFTRSSSLSN